MTSSLPPPSKATRPTPKPATTPATVAIEAEGLRKAYGSIQALDGIDLAIEPGTVFGLLGPNGAGKSTTVKVLTTLTRPDAGSARVAGLDVHARAAEVRRRIGVVSQKPQYDPQATGLENLVLQGRLYGVPRGECRARAAGLLERFGLGAAARRVVKAYSGGMQRKLDVALGLMHRPEVLFLDEPTTGLDPEARAEMWGEISRLAYDDGLTVLLTTHYLDEADELAERIAIVDRGRVVATGTPEGLKRELRGDALQIELADGVDGAEEPEDRSVEVLGQVPGVREIARDGRRLRARVDDGASAVPVVLGALEDGGVRVASVTVARPSLDDVYLRYAGRAFAAAEAENSRKSHEPQKSNDSNSNRSEAAA